MKCVQCKGEEAQEGRVRCGACLAKNAAAGRKCRERMWRLGKCRCGRALEEGFKRCAKCREAQNGRKRKNHEEVV